MDECFRTYLLHGGHLAFRLEEWVHREGNAHDVLGRRVGGRDEIKLEAPWEKGEMEASMRWSGGSAAMASLKAT